MDEEKVTYKAPVSNKKWMIRLIFGLVTVLIFGFICGMAGYFYAESLPDDEIVPEGNDDGEYYIGVWKNDVTGPVSQVNMMGYARPGQNAGGLHTRLYSRAFVIADKTKTNRVVFVSVDYGMTSQLVKLRVIAELKKVFGDLYTERNVVLSGTHTHSAPAGFFEYALFEVTSKGTVSQATNSYVEGIVRSITNAHNRMRLGNIYAIAGDLHDANINRSPSSYLRNPEEERAKYRYNTDHKMTLLRFDAASGGSLGIVTWFPVHPTSMNNTNLLINPDNKGRASTLFEKMMRKEGETLTGKESYVAAFASANLGDVSPNTAGPRCIDTGLDCDFETSTCPFNLTEHREIRRAQLCIARGPGKDMFQSTDIIGSKQFQMAAGLFNSPDQDKLSGSISFAHQYVDMSQEEFELEDGSTVKTCKTGLGYSFAAGCTDGVGALDFYQGMTEPEDFWEAVRAILIPLACSGEQPDAEYAACQYPKPVLFPTGYMDKPYQWHPHIVDVQLLRIGQIIIAAVPGEFSTMAGRRFVEAIREKAISQGMPTSTKVVIAGLSNVYSHYITTYEEYQAQRYEAASTLFGPHTHAAYVNRYSNLVNNLVSGTTADPGPSPPIPDGAPQLLATPQRDYLPEGVEYGDVIIDANQAYSSGDTVIVKFYGTNPRHNVKLGGTYLEVQRKVGSSWSTAYRDTDWETKFIWEDVSDAKTAQKEENVITVAIDMIARASGYYLDLARARQLFDMGKLKIDTTKSYEKLRKEMLAKGVLQKYSEPRATPGSDESHVTIHWDIPRQQQSGTYRIVYYGDYLFDNYAHPFTGHSKEFNVERMY